MEQNQNTSSQTPQLVQPKDFAKTVESIVSVYQGNHESLPELLSDAGKMLLKVRQKLTPVQLVLSVAAVAIGAIVLVSYGSNHQFNEAEEVR
ncbi:hypothetical protein ACD591_13610 [Rufibacter glacialis]|uniref:Uncharacterized protein n=1 Tax=Rufibacter glacialis TaxID=1259555 RepID=A0A5M8Q5I4_9BACT|nr:hypothetical protein [Rufibacter glacialis]KAA6431109.1 hypothetical protein FOE74_18615 [Rufibacter glacialis]GGK84117.1 hypothetical protein GCM10011405_35020 [Rufibacter glacialis]